MEYVFGLNDNASASTGYGDIPIGCHVLANANLRAYGTATGIGQYFSYVAGDTIQIQVETGQVSYYKNGALLVTVACTIPTGNLKQDVGYLNGTPTMNNINLYATAGLA